MEKPSVKTPYELKNDEASSALHSMSQAVDAKDHKMVEWFDNKVKTLLQELKAMRTA
jgi:hypothetical protein